MMCSVATTKIKVNDDCCWAKADGENPANCRVGVFYEIFLQRKREPILARRWATPTEEDGTLL
jgi:hypothetical protein